MLQKTFQVSKLLKNFSLNVYFVSVGTIFLFSDIYAHIYEVILEFSMIKSRDVGAWSVYVLEVSTY